MFMKDRNKKILSNKNEGNQKIILINKQSQKENALSRHVYKEP